MTNEGQLYVLGGAYSGVQDRGWDRQGLAVRSLVELSLDRKHQVEGGSGKRLRTEDNTISPAVLRPMAAVDNPYANLTPS